MNSLNIDLNKSPYKTLIGVGGIGSGRFFHLKGNHTIGREESRSGHFLDRNDYCKLHIISHYVQALLGQKFKVFPIGKVGDDEVGSKLLNEMRDIGFNIDFVERAKNTSTLFSFCFIYEDGSGGNLTTDDSACSKVDPDFISKAKEKFKQYSSKGIALAAPEVSIKARKHLLTLGTEFNFFRVASFTSEEMESVLNSKLLNLVDLLAINVDEAAALTSNNVDKNSTVRIVKSAIDICKQINPEILISITNGKEGSWVWDGVSLEHVASKNVEVVNTAGAGDAHLAGLIIGIIAGLSIKEAHELSSLIAALSVTSQHTINKKINRSSIHDLAKKSKSHINNKVNKFLEL